MMRRILVCKTLFLALLAITMLFPMGEARAQTEENLALERLVQSARDDGYQIILVPPENAGERASQMDVLSAGTFIEQRLTRARERLAVVLSEAPGALDAIAAAVRRHDPGFGMAWPLWAALLAALYLAIGALARARVEASLAGRFAGLTETVPRDRSDKILALGGSALVRTIGLAAQLTLAGLFLAAIDFGGAPFRITGTVILLWTGLAGMALIVFEAIFATRRADCRLIALDDAATSGLRSGFRYATIIAAFGGGACMWLAMSGAGESVHLLGLILAALATAILFSLLATRYRAEIGQAFLAAANGNVPAWRRLLAQNWQVLVVLYLVAAWVVTTIRLLLGLPNPLALVAGPVFALVGASIAYALALLAIDRWFADEPSAPDEEEDETGGPSPVRRQMKQLAEHGAAVIAMIGAVLYVLNRWQIQGAEALLNIGGLGEIAVVLFVAYMAYQAVKIVIDARIAEETPDIEEAELGDEGGAAGASRLATLLPIFRNLLLAVIATIAGMVVLSELGVDIAPLFAGAGVIGLAVGFGAQTLIRDMFSGAFFLIDDAFRRGEYIDVGGVKGTVEKISVRSMQLRHHLGPLHTIPFGEIQHLTNYSRDWVMMKLPLRVTYDTDVEKVRKLIKKLGQELITHPELGDKFLQPLKSQGVYKMEDSAMIIRVKFMTKPGDQFTVRKLVYSRIRELFEENGIRFAHREVTVRVADDDSSGRPLTPAQKDAIAGAVQPLVEAEATAENGGTGDQER